MLFEFSRTLHLNVIVIQNIFRHQKIKRSIDDCIDQDDQDDLDDLDDLDAFLEDQDDFPDDLDDLDAHRNVRPLAVLGERRPFERSRSIFAAARPRKPQQHRHRRRPHHCHCHHQHHHHMVISMTSA